MAAEVKASEEGRTAFVHDGRVVYEWEQTLEEVHVYIRPPPGVTAKMIECKIAKARLTVGLKGNPPFLDERLGGDAVTSDSLWMVEDGELHIQIQKAAVGLAWPAALAGHGALSEAEQQRVREKIMLERFQRENPGFDFSGAEFTGQAPDAREFMGGIDRSKLK